MLAMFLAPLAAAEDTDVVVLNNGKEIIGEVKNFLQGKLKFDTEQADKIYIDWDYVYFLTSSAFFEVYDENGVVYYGTLGTTTEKAVGGCRRRWLGRTRHGYRRRVHADREELC